MYSSTSAAVIGPLLTSQAAHIRREGRERRGKQAKRQPLRAPVAVAGRFCLHHLLGAPDFLDPVIPPATAAVVAVAERILDVVILVVFLCRIES